MKYQTKKLKNPLNWIKQITQYKKHKINFITGKMLKGILNFQIENAIKKSMKKI